MGWKEKKRKKIILTVIVFNFLRNTHQTNTADAVSSFWKILQQLYQPQKVLKVTQKLDNIDQTRSG